MDVMQFLLQELVQNRTVLQDRRLRWSRCRGLPPAEGAR